MSSRKNTLLRILLFPWHWLQRRWASIRKRPKTWTAIGMSIAHVTGALTTIPAVMETRTAQGAVAWAVALNAIPVVAVPAYWVFGRSQFLGYTKKRRETLEETDPTLRRLLQELEDRDFLVPSDDQTFDVGESLAKLPATTGNDVELLVNGEEIFTSILEGIEEAEDYILSLFYIVRDDRLGELLRDKLVEAADRGVRVYFLYDELGSIRLSNEYLDSLGDAGIEVSAFQPTRGLQNKFQVNFRNHRKIFLVDGKTAWVGGTNVGDEYLGLDPDRSPWIETMVRLQGPAVQLVQVAFLEDWHWATGEIPEWNWTPEPAESGRSLPALVVPTGPADQLESCALYFLEAIGSAQERFWVASPYFVPDYAIIAALQLAALRGVDVRVIQPAEGDSTLVNLASWAYIAPLETAGVQVLRHKDGFLHHKIFLIDDDRAAVGSANFDNRSFRLNFEIMLEVLDQDFASEIEKLFERDLAASKEVSVADMEEKGFWFQFRVRAARLFAPIL